LLVNPAGRPESTETRMNESEPARLPNYSGGAAPDRVH